MVGTAFVLVILYIYPTSLDSWQPLFSAARNHPDVTFRAVINPDSGPGPGPCPRSDFASSLAALNAISNIQTLAYVHTAAQSNCGSSGQDICVCSQPLSALRSNISIYQNWPTAGCSAGGSNSQDIHVDGIFFDESPSNTTCYNYMNTATSYARSLTSGNTVLFNSGTAVDSSYYGLADYINVFEQSEASYRSPPTVNAMTGGGTYAGQSTMIIYNYQSNADQLATDAQNIVGAQTSSSGGIAGLAITDLSVYNVSPTILDELAGYIGNINAKGTVSSSSSTASASATSATSISTSSSIVQTFTSSAATTSTSSSTRTTSATPTTSVKGNNGIGLGVGGLGVGSGNNGKNNKGENQPQKRQAEAHAGKRRRGHQRHVIQLPAA